jgi:hypothetical protein
LGNLIKIFCPKRKCGKCTRMVARVEEAIKLSGVGTKIEIVDSMNEILKYPTWILPTLVIKGKVAARGYVPSNEVIIRLLKSKKEKFE